MLCDTTRLPRSGIADLDRSLADLAEDANRLAEALDADPSADTLAGLRRLATRSRRHLQREAETLPAPGRTNAWWRSAYLHRLLDDLETAAADPAANRLTLIRLLEMWAGELVANAPRPSDMRPNETRPAEETGGAG